MTHINNLNFRVTQDDIHGTANSTINGADGWAAKAIAGRGILIDYESWANENNMAYTAMSAHAVPLEHVKAILKEKNITTCPGDILLLRTGMVISTDVLRRERQKAVFRDTNDNSDL